MQTQAPPLTCARLFSYHFVHIYIGPRLTLKGRISAPVAALINTAMKGVVSEQTRRKEDDCDDEFKGSPEEASRCTLQAGSARVDGRKAMTEYEAQVLAIREKTARLRALRLAKEAQAQNEEPTPKTKARPLKNRGTP